MINFKFWRKKERKEEVWRDNEAPLASGPEIASAPSLKEKASDGASPALNKDGASWDKIGKTALYIFIFLVPIFFLPWSVFPVAFNKQVLAVVLLLVVLICWLLRSIASGRIIYRRTFLNVIGFLLIVFFAASSFFSVAKGQSIWGDLVESDSLTALAIYMFAFFLFGAFLRKKQDLVKATFLFIVSLAILSIFAILQISGLYFLPWDFAQQISFNPVGTIFGLGLFLAFGLVVVLAMLDVLRPPLWMRVCLYLLVGLIGVILILLNFWVVWVGLLVAMALMVVTKMLRTKGKNMRELSLPVIILAVAALFLIVGRELPNFGVTLPFEISPSLSATFNIAKSNIEGVKEVFLGSGPATFAYRYALYRSQALNATAFWGLRFSQGFSALSTFLTTVGALGTGLLVLFFAVFMVQIFKGAKVLYDAKEENLVGGIFSGYLAGSVFLIVLWFVYPLNFTLALFTFLVMSLALISVGLIKKGQRPLWRNFGMFATPQRSLPLFLSAIVLIVAFFGLMYLVGQKYVASVYYHKGVYASNREGDVNKAISFLARAADLDRHQPRILRTLDQALILRMQEVVGQGAVTKSEQELEDLRMRFRDTLNSSISVAKKAIDLNPVDSLNWINSGQVYESVMFLVDGAADQAVASYGKAIELEPQNPQLPVNLARVYVALADRATQNILTLSQVRPQPGQEQELRDALAGQQALRQNFLEKAQEIIENSLPLKPDYAANHFLAAQIYDRQGKIKEAITRGENLALIQPRDSGTFFQLGLLYYKDNDFVRAQGAFERAVALKEDYSNARYFLGLVYDNAGRKDLAIEQFERIAELNPDNEEVRTILVNLRAGQPALDEVTPLPEERTEAPLPDTGGREAEIEQEVGE